MQLVHYAAAAAGASSGKRVRRAGAGRNRSVQRRRNRPAFRCARRAAGQRVSGGLGLTDDPLVHQEQVELVGEAVFLAPAQSTCRDGATAPEPGPTNSWTDWPSRPRAFWHAHDKVMTCVSVAR